MKKALLLLFVIFFFSNSFALNLKGCYKKVFKVSAYYSPVRWQKFYYRWNYYNEVKLNWLWIRWASYKRVFNWMLAAWKKYKFGTKIYFPGLWVWQVEDRWAAIVHAWQRWQKYDRIDIWVGKWEKALMRALSFWKQVRIWYVCPPTKRLKVWFNFRKFPIIKWFFKKTLWSIWIYKWRKDPWVKVLQWYLNKLGYLKHKPTWFYWKLTYLALIKFQKDNWIKPSYGYFWPKTRMIMKDKLGLSKKHIKVIKKKVNMKLLKIKKARKELALLNRWLWKWYNTYEVLILQKYLKKLWYYKWKIDGFYWKKTIEAVAKFQLDYKIIPSKKIAFAWYFGPKTRTLFKKIVLKSITL